MADDTVHLTVSAHGRPTGFELHIGDRRVPFRFVEAHRLTNDPQGLLGVLTVEADGSRVQVVIGGQTITLDEGEARQLARVPGQLRWLFALVVEMLSSRHRRERAG